MQTNKAGELLPYKFLWLLMPPEQHLLERTGGEPGGLCTLLTYCREILGHLIHTMTESSGILHIMATIHFIYALRMSREGEEAREPRKGRGEMSGDPKNKAQVEMLFLDVVISAHHQSADPSVPGQQSKASRARPSLWKEGSAERPAR